MKITCNIIQDLLPSYADDICSEDTKALIDEHIAECGQCRQKLEQMKNTGITVGKAANKQIDYLKKIRRTIIHKEWVGKFILMILVGITFMGLFVRYGGLVNYAQIPSAIFSILLFCSAWLAGNCRFSDGKKTATAKIGLSGTLFIFVLIIHEYIMQTLVKSRTPFSFLGMDLIQIGPFYTAILKITALIVVVLLIWNTFGKHKNVYASILNITALSHIAYVNDLLYHMDTPDSCMQTSHELAVSQIILAAAGIIACILLQKSKKIKAF